MTKESDAVIASLAAMARAIAEDSASSPDSAPMTERVKDEHGKWNLPLGTVVGESVGVFVFRRERQVVFVGRRDAVDGAVRLFGIAREAVERLARQNAMGRGRAYAASYRIGCIAALRSAARITSEQLRRAGEAREWYSSAHEGTSFEPVALSDRFCGFGFSAGRAIGA
jgi:hypothetical protein